MRKLRDIIKMISKPLRPLLARLDLLSPRVGVAVIIQNGDTILLGKRVNTTIGSGCWQCSGGHLEFMETFEDCARRETFEETGLTIRNILAIKATNNVFPSKHLHYITIWMIADVVDPTQLKQNLETKCNGWEWFPVNKLPSPLFEASGVLDEDLMDRIWR